MKINNFGIRAVQAYNQTQSLKKSEKNGESFADKIEISMKAKEMHGSSTYEASRSEKVASLKSDIEQGTYEVNARKIAEDMLKYYRG